MTPNQAFDLWFTGLRLKRVPAPTKRLVREAYTAGVINSAPTWQPMDMAPKDGTYILIKSGRRMSVVMWNGHCWWDGYGIWLRGWGPWFQRPTGWMPLPSP